MRVTECGTEVSNVKREPMNRDRIVVAAKQGDQARNRKALVTKARWRRCVDFSHSRNIFGSFCYAFEISIRVSQFLGGLATASLSHKFTVRHPNSRRIGPRNHQNIENKRTTTTNHFCSTKSDNVGNESVFVRNYYRQLKRYQGWAKKSIHQT